MWTIGLGEVPTKYVVAISSTESGAELHLEEYVDGKDEQLWDYDGGWQRYGTPGIIRNKNGLVADIDISSGRLIASTHHGGPSQKFYMRMWANLFATPVIIVSEVDGKVWELDQGTFTWGPDLNESDSQPKLRLSGAKINVKANNVTMERPPPAESQCQMFGFGDSIHDPRS